MFALATKRACSFSKVSLGSRRLLMALSKCGQQEITWTYLGRLYTSGIFQKSCICYAIIMTWQSRYQAEAEAAVTKLYEQAMQVR